MNIRKKRLIAAAIDFFTVVYISLGIFFAIIFVFNITDDLSRNILLYALTTPIYMCKDLYFKGESLGKKKQCLEILMENNEKPSNKIKILRSLTMYIWPIEVTLLILFNKRIGDIIFKTKVIEKTK